MRVELHGGPAPPVALQAALDALGLAVCAPGEPAPDAAAATMALVLPGDDALERLGALRERSTLPVALVAPGDLQATRALLAAGARELLETGLTAEVYACRLTVLLGLAERRQALRGALRDLQGRHAFLYDRAPVMLHSIDARGRLVSVSDAWLAALGYRRDEVLGRSSVEFLSEASRRKAVEEVLPAFFVTGVCTDVEYQFVRRDGRMLEVLLSAVAERDAAGAITRSFAVSVDVTGRRAQQRELLALSNPDDGDPDVMVQRLLRTAARTLGVERVGFWTYTREPPTIRLQSLYVQSRDAFEAGAILRGEDYPGYFRALAEDPIIIADDAWTDPRTAEFAASYFAPHGITSMLDMPVWFRRSLVGVLCHEHVGPRRTWTLDEREAARSFGLLLSAAYAADVQRHTEEALRRSEASFRELIERSPFALAVHRQEKVTYANPRWREALGDPEALPGGSLRGLLHPDDSASGEAFRPSERPAPDAPRELRLRSLHGGEVIAEVTSIPVEFDGEPATVTIARDVTEQRRIQAQLLLADRMVSVGTLAAGVAHEINNPLAYVAGNLSFLADHLTGLGGATDAPQEGLVAALVDAQEGVRRISRIVRDLKTFSRADEERRSALDVRDVLEVSLRMVSNELRHRTMLVRSLAPVPQVDANEARLGQVFLNLLVNALQALPDRAPEENLVRVATFASPSGEVLIEVSDNGAGMAPDVRRRIFDPFFTTKPVGVGTGLGLSVCQGVVQALGGVIEVDSEPGQGSVFRVRLPALKEPRSVAPRSPPPTPLTESLSVLVVDDEPLIGHVVRRLLQPEHLVVLETDAPSALARLDAGERFEVILCDLMMPGMTGMDFHERLREKHPALLDAVIFMTGGAFTASAREFLERVPNPHLSKPFDVAALRKLLEAFRKR
ncbi:MAG: PAS domain S-box protein [Deltaproteobacteria bacterium]|nr:PAS domain S-box protein [Deltaproteobacteria bacterium]